MKKSGRLLIVGGTGFIGRSVAHEAINRGFQVSIISKNNCPKLKQIVGVEYIVVDITKKKELLFKLKGRLFDYVINLGGYVNHSNYSNGGDEVFDVHFNGAVNLVHCIDKNNIKSFIQIGSSDEYGNATAPQSEYQRESPISAYSFAKTATTHFLKMLHNTEKFPSIVLRLFLVYGPGQDKNRFVPQVINNCLADSSFPVSKGEQLRDFCFISDAVNAIFLAINNSDAFGEIINIASGNAISIKDVVNKIHTKIGSGDPQFGKISYRVGENMNLYANINKANKVLKWYPKVDFDQGLRNTIDYYQNI